MNKVVKFYQTEQGTKPVAEFLDTLTGKQAQKIVWVLQLYEDLPCLPKQYFKHLVGSAGIWEFRAQFSGNIFRVLGFLDGSDFIATNGFQKKTQKTPKAEIELAEQRKVEYLKRRICNE